RIYYRASSDYGATWQGSANGQPLEQNPIHFFHDFHPQLASTPDGLIGCAFYEFGALGPRGRHLISVVMAISDDNAATFAYRGVLTDRAWDPAVDAPRSHGNSTTTFIGDYFGLAASQLGFFPFWTDTRTGIQEIFTDQAQLFSGPPTIGLAAFNPPPHPILT